MRMRIDAGRYERAILRRGREARLSRTVYVQRSRRAAAFHRVASRTDSLRQGRWRTEWGESVPYEMRSRAWAGNAIAAASL